MGSWSEYALTTASFLALKPKNLSHVEAASLPMIGMTTVQAFEKVPNGFVGGTVLIPAGRRSPGLGTANCT
jgi:NADPH:quinone reductase-like Zn-dependent oxidoreductase